MFFVKDKIIYRDRWYENLVHTGQHYDYEMSQAFFEDLAFFDPFWLDALTVATRKRDGSDQVGSSAH